MEAVYMNSLRQDMGELKGWRLRRGSLSSSVLQQEVGLKDQTHTCGF